MKIPGMDSIDALREVRARQSFVELIMLTRHDGVEDRSTETAP